MCFTIHESHSEVKIATEDILCYKIFIPSNFGDAYLTPFRRTRVLPKSLMESEIGQSVRDRWNELSYGIHSFTSLEEATAYGKKKVDDYNQAKYVECTIPKGSEYYFNPETKQYISNQLQLGLVINAGTGEIDVAASTPGTYVITLNK